MMVLIPAGANAGEVTAQGSSVYKDYRLYIGPVDAGNGYDATLIVMKLDRRKDYVHVLLSKSEETSVEGIIGSGTQTHRYVWSGGVYLTEIASDLTFARVGTGSLAGSGGWGQARGRFVSISRIKRTRECGSDLPLVATRTGKFRGSAIIDTHNDAFGTIDFSGAPATMEKQAYESGGFCGEATPTFYCKPGLHFRTQNNAFMDVLKQEDATYVEALDYSNDTTPQAFHEIKGTTNDPTALTGTSDLSTGSINLDSVPFLSGATTLDDSHVPGQDQTQCSYWGISGPYRQVVVTDPLTIEWDGLADASTTPGENAFLNRLSKD
jgi:hypothetical protein